VLSDVRRESDRFPRGSDVALELDEGARPIEILSIGVELEEVLGVKVDVDTPASLRERLRDEA